MNQATERSFIAAERVHSVEIRQTPPADCTEIVLIERIVVDERGAAGPAKKFGFERLGEGKAGGANWNSRDIRERLVAKPTLVWKD